MQQGGFGLAWKNGSAASATETRTSISSFGSRIRPRRKSSGDTLGSATAAQMAALFNTDFLFGVPDLRPPRRSPSLDPRGIAVSLLSFCQSFATLLFCYFAIFLVGVG